jgi:hypothetical protein
MKIEARMAASSGETVALVAIASKSSSSTSFIFKNNSAAKLYIGASSGGGKERRGPPFFLHVRIFLAASLHFIALHPPICADQTTFSTLFISTLPSPSRHYTQ